jgi:hypothetical protein
MMAAPIVPMAGLCFLIAGWPGLVVGFLWSTVLLYHATFCINSLAHVQGRKRYVTGDDPRNNWLLALFTMGEGWRNNHHAYQSSARQGFRWWEIDVTYYVLVALSWLGIVWDAALSLQTGVRAGFDRSASKVQAMKIVRSSQAASVVSCGSGEATTARAIYRGFWEWPECQHQAISFSERGSCCILDPVQRARKTDLTGAKLFLKDSRP